MRTYAAVTSGTLITKIESLHQSRRQRMFPIVKADSHRYLGYITYDDVQAYRSKHTAMSPDTITSEQVLIEVWPAGRDIHAHLDESPSQALAKIREHNLEFLPVVDDRQIYIGTIDAASLSGRWF